MIRLYYSSFYTTGFRDRLVPWAWVIAPLFSLQKTINKLLILLPSGNKLVLFNQTVDIFSLCSHWLGYLLRAYKLFSLENSWIHNIVSIWKHLTCGSKHPNTDVTAQSQYYYLPICTCLYFISVSVKHESC